MEFLDLPNEMKEHIFLFVQVPNYALCCRDFFSVFQNIKQMQENKPFRQLVKERSIFSCLPKFSADFWECRNLRYCGYKGFGLPIKVHMNAYKNHEESRSALSMLAAFPNMAEFIPEESLQTFLFFVGKKDSDRSRVCPEYIAGYVHECFTRLDLREAKKNLAEIGNLGLPDHQKEEAVKLATYVTARLDTIIAYSTGPFKTHWLDKELRKRILCVGKKALPEEYTWLKKIC
ncbi:hypothetical protein [Brazilian marseillevirus]|uniref:hypothetical protein n=1 Tax=Brazilian marseillevirus TaxID=1813599 RepID=UPI0007818FC3|nr:hypothetical protein A3303_gp362 [Brazilian marseillevirus]AMQ10870.1 hypothetical protein [Brazilian marseillevirus]